MQDFYLPGVLYYSTEWNQYEMQSYRAFVHFWISILCVLSLFFCECHIIENDDTEYVRVRGGKAAAGKYGVWKLI